MVKKQLQAQGRERAVQKEVEKIIYSCDTEGNVYRLYKLKGSLALYTSDRIEKDFLLDMESVWDAS